MQKTLDELAAAVQSGAAKIKKTAKRTASHRHPDDGDAYRVSQERAAAAAARHRGLGRTVYEYVAWGGERYFLKDLARRYGAEHGMYVSEAYGEVESILRGEDAPLPDPSAQLGGVSLQRWATAITEDDFVVADGAIFCDGSEAVGLDPEYVNNVQRNPLRVFAKSVAAEFGGDDYRIHRWLQNVARSA